VEPQACLRVTLALVFLCGAGGGRAGHEPGVHSHLHQPAFDTPAGKVLYFDRLQKELKPDACADRANTVDTERFLAVLPHRAKRQQSARRATAERRPAPEV